MSLTTQGQTRCEDCPRDTYQGQTAASSCSLCPQRHQHATQHTGAVSVTQCECGGGHEMPQRALPGDNCTQCAAGFEKPLPGTQPCTQCDLGTYSPSPAHATCLLCPPGRSLLLLNSSVYRSLLTFCFAASKMRHGRRRVFRVPLHFMDQCRGPRVCMRVSVGQVIDHDTTLLLLLYYYHHTPMTTTLLCQESA